MSKLHIGPSMGVSLAALVLAASGGAYAAATSSGTIVACAHHTGGGLYVAQKCGHQDKHLRWSVTGPRGPRGAQGSTGQTGAQGPQGAQGVPGPGAVKLNYHGLPDNSASPTTLGTVGPWTLAATCTSGQGSFAGVPFPTVTATLYAKGPGAAEYDLADSQNDNNPATFTGAVGFSASGFATVVKVTGDGPPVQTTYERLIGTVILQDDTSIAVLDVNVLADPNVSPHCKVVGDAIPTT